MSLQMLIMKRKRMDFLVLINDRLRCLLFVLLNKTRSSNHIAMVNEVVIYIRNKMIAKLALGSTPGWSTVVVKDGPLARVL